MVFNHLISGHVDLVQQVGENENRIQVSSPAAVTSLFVVFFFQLYGRQNVTWERSRAHVTGGHVDLTSQKEIFA